MVMKDRYTLIERSDTPIVQSYLLQFAASTMDLISLLSTNLKLVYICNKSVSSENNFRRLSTKE